jgi:uncharacterized protein involved in exopolysaccharide biosynthesis
MLAAMAGVWAFTRPRAYTSISSFVAEGRQTAAGGLAAQLGLTLPGAGGTESPQFYRDLLRSREILGMAVTTPLTVPGVTTRPTTLIELYALNDAEPAIRRDRAMAQLNKALDLDIALPTGVVTVKVSASSPGLAQALNRRMFELLGEFNLKRRQSRASEERRFAEGRLTSVKAELRVAENRLQYFLQSNRDYRNAPALQFEYERLQADVELLRQVVTTLQQSTEQAKLEEVRDTPTVTLIESPSVPVRPDPRGTIKYSLIAFVLGSFLGMGLAFVRETVAGSGARGSSDYEEFAQLWRETRRDLRRPWRLFRRPRGTAMPGSATR